MARSPRHRDSIAHRRRPRRPLTLLCEPLEPRELMSKSPFSMLFGTAPAKSAPVVPIKVSSELPPNVSGRIQCLYELSLTSHPLYQGNVVGHVVKAPMFNPGYTGPKRLDLDVIGARALVSPQQGFVLTGEVLGPIDPAQPAIYSFLIGRGSMPGGPKIAYNLKVSVTDGPGGPVGAVSALNSRQEATSSVALSPSSLRLKGNSVQVTVPSSVFPSTASPAKRQAAPSTYYLFEAAVPGGRTSDIAGFAPGFMTL
jgi:hypothetical protein